MTLNTHPSAFPARILRCKDGRFALVDPDRAALERSRSIESEGWLFLGHVVPAMLVMEWQHHHQCVHVTATSIKKCSSRTVDIQPASTWPH